MKLLSAVLLTAFVVPAVAFAQAIDLGPDVSGYTRFIVYPHLQKGLESMQRGDRERAFSELERARSLAPENATVALHLAAAYRKFGENERAEKILREQLKWTPLDARVKGTLAEIEAASRLTPVKPAVVAAAPVATVAKARPAPVMTPRKPSTARLPVSPRTVPTPASVSDTVPILTLPDGLTQAQARFTTAVSEKRFAEAAAAGDELLALDASPATLDDVSFKLVDASADEEALRVLLKAYPFTDADAEQREVLLQRMIPLVERHRGELADIRFQPLRLPLDTAALRSRQGVLWTSVGDCKTVRAVLGDLSSEYGHDDWVRLGDCAAAADPVLARHAYATAHAMNPGGKGSMALAYAAFAAGDFRASLDAWRTIGAGRLSRDELLAASTTALAAGEDQQALDWLEAYRTHGDTPDERYWSLVGRGRIRMDTPGAIAAFERAVALRPDVNDLLRLAQLETDPGKRVSWLEQAITLDSTRAATQAELGYAYARAGRAAASLEAFEKSAALDPTNTGVQVELGFAYWRAGRTADAVRALERAYQADPSNMMVTRQLVYAEQRLANNNAARRYAERVLDTPGAFSQETSDLTPLERADLRFGFQRLHEDLGRRVTVNLDGFSGTRVGASAPSAQPGSHYRSYAQIEADVRLGKESIRDGTTVSAYARVFADGGELRSAFPSENAVLGAGLRWKPWRSHVVYLAAEGQNGLDDGSRRDVMLRASASFLNGGRFGDDWHPARAGWFSQNLYLDAARYLKSDFSALTADYRTSYHKRVADGNTLEPYTHVQFSISGTENLERDIRAGAGARWNIWHGGSNYDADPHKLSLGVEFQHAFDTYLPDRNGLFLTLGSRW